MRLKGFPPLITLLLISSLVLTIGRAITLPFITIYMTEHFHLKPESVGLILGFSLAIGIVSSFYGGYLVDKFNKHHLMILSIALFAMTFCIMPWLGNVWWMVPVLTLLHAAYSVFSIAIKACFAEWLPVSERIRGFSMNYTLVNVGWAVGPALGVFAASYYPMLPFFLSGMLAFFVGLTLWLRLDGYGLPPNNGDTVFTEQRLNFSATFKILSHDRRLIFFTLGSTMGAVVAGQFTGYLSQYLITVSNAQFAYQVIGSVMTVNASVVICLQYLLSRNMNNKNLLRWLTAGTLFFLFWLSGFRTGRSLHSYVDGCNGNFHARRSDRYPRRISVYRLYCPSAFKRELLRSTKSGEFGWRREPNPVRIFVIFRPTYYAFLCASGSFATGIRLLLVRLPTFRCLCPTH